MRFYNIIISDQNGNVVQSKSCPIPGTTYTSYLNGQTLPGALNVELEVTTVPFALPAGSGGDWVRIWGIGIQDISQSFDLNYKSISVYAGMQHGLPLANPAQSGLIVTGSILPAFGNWQGLTQTLDLVIVAPIGSSRRPKNITQDWKAGTPLATAIQNTLSTAFPGTKANISISPNLVLAHDEPGFYGSLPQYARYIKDVSRDIIGGSYQGVDIMLRNGELNVYDGSTQKSPISIQFQDMVGQPTWIGLNSIQISCVMRADIGVGDSIKLPSTPVISGAQSASNLRQGSVFQGTFLVTSVRHVGNYRQPDGNSWITTIDAIDTSGSGTPTPPTQ